MDSVGAVVIGAGVVGLAIARALAMRGHETVLLEAADAFGTGTSSRNSEVIHAGIYYPAGSLKARLCVAGRERLVAYAECRQVAHRRCGKLIVATDEAQRPKLADLQARAARNGVALRPVGPDELRRFEPALAAVAALESPATGIVDSHGLMLALLGDLEAHGGMLALCSPVRAITPGASGHTLEVGGAVASEIVAPIVVNAAGLSAVRVAAGIAGWPAERLPRLRYAKGNYFAVSGRSPFSRLIYPVPEPGGLGVHLTLDLAGQARFGPDVEWLPQADDPAAIDYRVDPARRAGFEAAVRRYWPDLPDDALQPAYSGVRPKVTGPGEPDGDFVLDGPAEHGVAGLLNLYGIESPGLTACLALADEAVRRLDA